jgi:hypothetical protein
MTPSSTLSRIRALPAIAALAEVWQRRDDEPDEAYAAFMAWLAANPAERSAPPGPPAPEADWARRFEWAERALAYERASAMAAAESCPTPVAPEVAISNNLLRMVVLETDKLLKQAASTRQPVVALKDLIATMNLFREMQLAGLAAKRADGAAASLDLSALSQDEKRTMLEAQRIQRKLLKK